ncbi:efflux transporter periplasmic adaptor subunit [Candidatus Thiodiazotropha endoloripes]|uniref:efflux RND transporter periplasmic adaptor subunit n=1 Tax=Candidatus Thiodiazotropha endoloripes TaxID=1818881 RepID=UPI00083DE60C|nr:efflux RND transporter periplasmic adaptor subunit [Candidatus Thiodiazotropha endoloripes]MCG7901905.1 efflux RND transporter periplasmic adaptor subunit [Candidatus Thiodiazotropha weberae]ODB93819.1 efflux transporter periplasmic adaptor subunit [Candidatus Thiodiazotropha endoloripes]
MTTVIRRFLLSLAILIVTVLIVLLLIATRPEANMEIKEPAVTRVEVTRVVQRDVLPEVTYTGLLRPRQTASLRFEVSGELLQRHVEPGQLVEAESLLLQLEDADYQDALTEAASQLSETRATLQRDQKLLDLARENRGLAEREYKRLEKLGKGSLASVSTLESSRQQLINLQAEEARLAFSLQSNRARIERQRAALSRAQRNLDRTRLLAPFSGRVNRVMVEAGDYVSANTLVLELIDSRDLELRVAVNGDVVAALELGQQLVVEIDEQQVNGKLIALQYDPDSQTHTHPLRIQVDNRGLIPGQLGQVKLPLRERKGALVVPASALLREEGKHYVFLIRDNHLVRQEIIPGLRYGELQIVQHGLQPNQQLVARDVDVLSDGNEVQIEDLRADD